MEWDVYMFCLGWGLFLIVLVLHRVRCLDSEWLEWSLNSLGFELDKRTVCWGRGVMRMSKDAANNCINRNSMPLPGWVMCPHAVVTTFGFKPPYFPLRRTICSPVRHHINFYNTSRTPIKFGNLTGCVANEVATELIFSLLSSLFLSFFLLRLITFLREGVVLGWWKKCECFLG